MRKEVVMAIIFGLLVGLGVTFAVYKLNNRNPDTNQSVTERITLDPVGVGNKTATAAALVTIKTPGDESVHEVKEAELTGETFPNQLVVVFVNEDEHLLQTNDQGQFSLSLELESGSNIISAHVIDPATNEVHQTQITVIYTNKSLEEKLVSDQEVKNAAQNGTTQNNE